MLAPEWINRREREHEGQLDKPFVLHWQSAMLCVHVWRAIEMCGKEMDKTEAVRESRIREKIKGRIHKDKKWKTKVMLHHL